MKCTISLLISCLLIVSCSNNNSEEDITPKLPEQSKEKVCSDPDKVNATGIFYDTLRAKSDGTIEWISNKESFHKGTHLFTVNNSRRFMQLFDEKAAFKAMLDSLIEHCPTEISTVKTKWQKFEDQLRFDTLTPRFPEIQYREEASHFASKRFISSYNKIILKEKQMKSNFQFAQFQYTSISWEVKKGKQVKKGQIVAIARIDTTSF